MKKEKFREQLVETIKTIEQSLVTKGEEYIRNGNVFHTFDEAAKLKGETRERALYGMLVKQLVSVNDIRDDIDKGIMPDKKLVLEKYKDVINYFILEKIAILDRISEQEFRHPTHFLNINTLSEFELMALSNRFGILHSTLRDMVQENRPFITREHDGTINFVDQPKEDYVRVKLIHFINLNK